jgi:hypothetical protein
MGETLRDTTDQRIFRAFYIEVRKSTLEFSIHCAYDDPGQNGDGNGFLVAARIKKLKDDSNGYKHIFKDKGELEKYLSDIFEISVEGQARAKRGREDEAESAREKARKDEFENIYNEVLRDVAGELQDSIDHVVSVLKERRVYGEFTTRQHEIKITAHFQDIVEKRLRPSINSQMWTCIDRLAVVLEAMK